MKEELYIVNVCTGEHYYRKETDSEFNSRIEQEQDHKINDKLIPSKSDMDKAELKNLIIETMMEVGSYE